MKTIEFAINMEREGQRFYEELADRNKDNELFTVFLILAEAEKAHKELLRKRKDLESIVLDDFVRPDIKKVYKELKNFRRERSEKQLDIYRMACAQERNSIALYQDHLGRTMVPENRELYQFLIKEEQGHLKLFEDLVMMLTRPEEWVESAEFGEREEY